MDNGRETGMLSLPRNPGSIFDVALLSSLSPVRQRTPDNHLVVKDTRYGPVRGVPMVSRDKTGRMDVCSTSYLVRVSGFSLENVLASCDWAPAYIRRPRASSAKDG